MEAASGLGKGQGRMDVITIRGVDCYEKDGVAYLHIEDVARGLGFTTTQKINGTEYTNVRWTTVKQYLHDLGFLQEVAKDTYIPENIFYRLAMKAKNEAAERFQALIADEVIPAIRKHGGYLTPDAIEKVLDDPDTIIRLATNLKEERMKRREAERQRDILLHVKKTFTSTEIAKELGISSARTLNGWLAARKVQFKQNGTWVLYSKYAEMGLTEIKQQVLDSGKIVYDRRWTNDGRNFILNLFQQEEINDGV